MAAVSGTRNRALRRALVSALLIVWVVALAPPAAMSSSVTATTTYWVDDGGNDANPGTEALPFKTITHALEVASGGDTTIMVKPGTYDEANGEDFPLLPGGESIRSSGGADVTIVSGNGTDSILIVNNPTEGDTISGLTFTNGGGSYAVLVYLGFSSGQGWPLIEDNVFRDNIGSRALTFSQWGDSAFSGPVVRNNEFIDNSAEYGAGLWVDMQVGDSTLVVEDNLFMRNETVGPGGAMSFATADTTITITNNTFFENSTSYNGGAIYLGNTGGQTHTIAGNAFTENEALDSGGALWLSGATVELLSNDFGGNDALNGYGGFARSQNCTITAENNAGGGNFAALEGAAWAIEDSVVTLTNETIGYNGDAAHAVYADIDSTLTIDNCILWNPAIPDVVGADHIASSCVRDPDVNGTGVMHDDPGWANPDPDSHDLRLGGDSPCIDTADPAVAPATDFFGTARPVDGDLNGSTLPDIGAHEFVPPVPKRLSDRTRYSTAVEIAEEAFPGWAGVTDVVVASGEDRAAADPLAASGLCWAYDAPMLLVSSTAVSAEVKTAIADIVAENGPVSLRIVGGTTSVPNARINEIKAYVGAANVAATDRLATTGGRYDLARAIAKRMKQVADADPDKEMPDVVLFANGADATKFFDALALSPISAANGAPILLVTATTVPSATTAALADLGNPPNRVVGGGPNTVSNAVVNALGAERWSGQSRYDTAIVIANNAVTEGWLNRQTVGVAAKLPDALTGGSCVGRMGGVLVLTDGATLTPATKTWLMTYRPQILACYIFGGENSLAPSVVTAIWNALK